MKNRCISSSHNIIFPIYDYVATFLVKFLIVLYMEPNIYLRISVLKRNKIDQLIYPQWVFITLSYVSYGSVTVHRILGYFMLECCRMCLIYIIHIWYTYNGVSPIEFVFVYRIFIYIASGF